MLWLFRFLLVSPVICMDPMIQDLVTPLRYMGEACGYESCPLTKPDTLNVHIVPHTHAELGYTKTFHQHYTGHDDYFDQSQINMKRILDYTITELWSKERRKFTLSDTPYFFHWWSQRDDTVRRMVYELLRQGRLYFVGGGWSMSDEATTSYHAIIDHFTYTLRKINKTFLNCGRPLVTWQADAFGHSREFASLMAQMGFDGHFVNPISYDDELARMRRNALEFVWRGSDDLGVESDIYTHKLFDGYWSPPGFCFGSTCHDPLIVTSDSVFKNVDERVNAFFKSALHRQAPYYTTNNIMVVMGQRLGYFDASVWFNNIDKLIDHVNNATVNGTRLNVFYSTPACYMKAVHDAYPQLSTKQDDFLPYAYDSATYTTGFYTSRPNIKYMAREGHLYLQMAKQLQVTAQLGNNDQFFEQYNWINGVFQDHNIISGAMRQHVKDYYTEKMYIGTQQAISVIRQAFNKLRDSPKETVYYRCSFNISCCLSTHGEHFFVVIYNPLAWPVTVPVRLPTYRSDYVVYRPDGQKIRCALIPIPEPVCQIPYRKSRGRYELVFIADDVPPMGYRSYYIRDRKLGWIRNKRSIIKKINRNNKKYYVRQTNSFNYDDNEPMNAFEHVSELNNDNDYEYFDESKVNDTKDESNNETDSIVPKIGLNDVNDSNRLTTVASANSEAVSEGINDINKVVNFDSKINTANIKTNDKMSVTTDNTIINVTMNKERTVTNTSVDEFITTNMNKEDNITTSRDEYKVNKEKANKKFEATTKPDEEFEDPKEEIWRGSQYVEVTDHFIRNRFIKVNINDKGKIKLVELINGINISLNIEFLFYASDDPDKMGTTNKRPGAYVFRAMDPKPEVISDYYDMRAYKNGLLQELHAQFADYASFALRLYRRTPYIELEWLIGPIPCKDNIGKDVFIRYSTDLDNKGVFYTDSNGRQTLKRIRNSRASFELGNQDPVAGNFYPVTSKIYIEDLKRNIRFSVFNDRAQGGSSLSDGQIDLMLNRQLFTDDAGIQAFVNETENGRGLIVRGKHYLYITKANNNRIFEKKFSKEIELKPTVFVSKKSVYGINTKRMWYKQNNEFSAIKTKLPLGVHILTLEKWNGGTILLRLENYLEKSDVRNGVKEVLLKNLFEVIKILGVNETTLGGNVWLKDWVPLQWDKKEKFVKNFNEAYGAQDISFSEDEDLKPMDNVNLDKPIILSPQQIRTFVLTYEYIKEAV
ncbi:lysosomal alpha-mannosidase-like [Achroia grisella]|uniref:lysosomal alpha-mannosidase-like n=1 Tax=Achroia grisella TaxID=688607 RepID=UPI0027D32432|nr:lysosomal alpha-mannosidase-like [Achroia grisella]